MYACATELLLGYILAYNGLHNLGTGEEHIAGILLHNHEVGQCGRVNSTTCARTKNQRNLGNNTARHNVALENLCVTCQSVHTLLDTCTTRVVQTDNGSTIAHSHIHNFANLLCHSERQRTCRYGEVLCENIDKATAYGTVTGNNTISQGVALLHTEVHAAVGYEHIELLKATLIQEHSEPLTSGVFTLLVLGVDTFLTATHLCLLAQLDQLRNFVLNLTHNFVCKCINVCVSHSTFVITNSRISNEEQNNYE